MTKRKTDNIMAKRKTENAMGKRVIVLSVFLLFTAFDYRIGIFKYFFLCNIFSIISK
jgi:membrane protein insertase Oxa1/YidC/SpoIIIJ